MSPQRIQLRRTKGWRKPEGAVVVSRPSKWGNEFEVWREGDHWCAEGYDPTEGRYPRVVIYTVATPSEARKIAAEAYRKVVTLGNHWWGLPDSATVRTHLAGRDLACWCPLDQPCHADALLEIANAEEAR